MIFSVTSRRPLATESSAGKRSVNPFSEFFEALSIKYDYVAAVLLDEVLGHELLYSERHAWAGITEHQTQKFVRHWHVIAANTVDRQQQPPGEPFVNFAATVGHRSLADLDKERVSKPHKHAMQGDAFFIGCSKDVSTNPSPTPSDLHENIMFRTLTAHYCSDGRQAIVTYDTNFDRLAGSIGNDGRNPLIDKVHVLYPLAAIRQLVAQGEIYGLEVWFEDGPIRLGDAGQNVVRAVSIHRFS
jgi:hypothetical protein